MRELSQHVLDLVYNCIEAGARHVRIAIAESSREDRLTICVDDDGRGMTAEQAARALDPFYTTRTTRKVGLGIPLLREKAQACCGDVTITSCPGEGTTVTATFQHSHVDRQPLGDMASTMVVAVSSAPEVEFRYQHEVDGRVFTFDTTELKQELEGLSLTHPSVMRWLEGTLQEGLQTLRG